MSDPLIALRLQPAALRLSLGALRLYQVFWRSQSLFTARTLAGSAPLADKSQRLARRQCADLLFVWHDGTELHSQFAKQAVTAWAHEDAVWGGEMQQTLERLCTRWQGAMVESMRVQHRNETMRLHGKP
ncbi:hypothetical protein [Craterilacuibacter sp.]|uniref:hypothetical protein n=1 Tax=Craterilacuibacter sp. TaxID=2870909 RepID=UPI003F39A672